MCVLQLSDRCFRLHLVACGTTLLAVWASPRLEAATVNHGDHTGSHVVYRQVIESSTTGDELPLYGPPVVASDTLNFSPLTFTSSSGAPGGADITDAQLSFAVEAKAGSYLTALDISGLGDALMAGFNVAAFANVAIPASISITQVDFQSVTPIGHATSLVMSPSDGTFSLGEDGGGGLVYATFWSGSRTVDLAAILGDAGVPLQSGATKVNVTINVSLATISEPGAQSNISVKQVAVASSVADVAEPELAADFNGSLRVDGGDLAILTSNFGDDEQTDASHGDADLNTIIDGNDVLIWQQENDSPVPESFPAVQPIPEPSSLTAAAVLFVMAFSYRAPTRSSPKS